MTASRGTTRVFQFYAWSVLLYHLAVVVWGAFVRATGAGAGCGEHWPLCNGAVVPRSPTLATAVEWSHRVTSGLALSLVLVLIALAFWNFPRRHLARRAATAAAVFEMMEALIGAAIVLLGHVARNTSAGRAYTLSAHLINTLFLLGALTLVAWSARDVPRSHIRRNGSWRGAFAFCTAGILLLGVSGAIAALGDTLFQASSLTEGMRQDFLKGAHPFLRLRVWHPAIAALVSTGLLTLSYSVLTRTANPAARRSAIALIFLLLTQLAIGAVNLALLAPVALQLVHLLFADLVWICFVLMTAEVFSPFEPLHLSKDAVPTVLVASR